MTRTECEKLIIENLKMLHTMIKEYTGDRLISMSVSDTHVSVYAFDDDENYIINRQGWYDGTEYSDDGEEQADE